MRLFKKPSIAKKSYTTYQLMPSVSWTAKWSPFSRPEAIRQGYKRSTWVYACVRLRANNVASVPWLVERRTSGEWEPVEAHPLKALIERPNPSFDWSMLMRQISFALDLSGDAYLSKVRNGAGATREVWPLIPDVMEILPGREQLIRAYRYRLSSVTREIPAEDILHVKYANPGDLYYGLSPLEAAGRAVDIDEEAEKWQKTSLQNMAVPPGALVMEGDVGQDEYEQAKRWIREQRGSEHAREMWVLANAKWQSMGQSAVDLDFSAGRKMTREEICAAYSVPPPLVGIYDHATLANIQTSRKILWLEGLIPTLDEIEGQLNLSLASEFGEDIRLRYDLSNVDALSEDFSDKIRNARGLWAMGVPLSEINQRLEIGLDTENIANADIGYISPGLLPTDFDFDTSPEPGGRDAGRAAFGDNDE